MDTDHPVFQVAAPEYDEAPEDVFLENVVEHGATLRISFSTSQLRLIRGEFKKFLIQTETESSAKTSVSTYRELDRISSIFAYIKDSSNSLQALDCVAYSFGIICRDGESMRSVANEHGVSRQAFSNQVAKFQEEFRIAPRSGMRPTAQRKIYEAVHRQRWDHIDQDAPKKQP